MARIRRVRGGAGEAAPAANELAQVMTQMRKRYGDNVMALAREVVQPWRIPTGVFLFDFATLGGVPYNRISHVIGQRSAGKSTMADFVIAGAQNMFPDQVAAKLDIEGTQDSVWSAKLGVDLDRLHVIQPETGEAAVDVADALVHTKEVSIVVIDSIAALVPMKEIEDSAEDAQVGLQARLVGKMIRKVTAGLIKERQRGHYVTVLLVNQYRTKIGGWSPTGEPLSIPGGKALEFAATLQWVIKNKEQSGKDAYDVEVITRNEHVFQINKNKMNAGLRSGEFTLIRTPDAELGLSEGSVDDAETMLTYAKKFGAYTGAGSKWRLRFWDDDMEFKGVREAVAALYGDIELKWRLRQYLIHEHASHLNMPEEFLARFRG